MEMQKEIEVFLASPGVRKGLAAFGKNARTRIRIADETFAFFRDSKGLRCVPIAEDKGGEFDMEFTIPPATVYAMVQRAADPKASVADLALTALPCVFTEDPKRKVTFEIYASLFTLVRKGYFSVLIAGGPDVLRFLGQHGFGSLEKIRNAASQIRRPKE